MAGAFALIMSLVSFGFANGDMAILSIVQFLIGLEFAGRYVYLLVLTGCIVGVALKATRRIYVRRNG